MRRNFTRALFVAVAVGIASGSSWQFEEAADTGPLFQTERRSLLSYEDLYSEAVDEQLASVVWTYAPTPEGGWKVQGITIFEQGPDYNQQLEFFPGTPDDYLTTLSASSFTYLDYFNNTGCIELGVNGSDPGISAFISTRADSFDPDYQNLTVRAVAEVPVELNSRVKPADGTKLFETDPAVSYTVFAANSNNETDQKVHLQAVLHPPNSEVCKGGAERAPDGLPKEVTPLGNEDALPAHYTYQLQQVTGASCLKYTFSAVALGEGNEGKQNVTVFIMTSDQATQFIASNFSSRAIQRLGTVSQCVISKKSLKTCERTANKLDPKEIYFTFARD